MKIKDLIAMLEKFDGETEIYVEDTDIQLCGCINPISGVDSGLERDTGKFPVVVLLLDREEENIWYDPEDVLALVREE